MASASRAAIIGDDDQTRQRFITHPRTGARLYRTGDLGRVLPDGNIEILGRDDFQVKLRGHRVELAEVEAALAAAPGVRQAIAVAIGERGDQRLVAFVVGDAPDPAAVRAAVGAKLPPYMVPDVRVAAELPLTTNGKVDRVKLAALAVQQVVAPVGGDGVEPRAASMVARILAIVADVLGANELSADADLFTLGATSVDFIRIANSLEATFGSRPAIEQFFAAPTVAAIARFYERAPAVVTPVATGTLASLAVSIPIVQRRAARRQIPPASRSRGHGHPICRASRCPAPRCRARRSRQRSRSRRWRSMRSPPCSHTLCRARGSSCTCRSSAAA